MREMIGRLLHTIERWLYRRGFAAALVRRLMAVQMLVAAACVLGGIPLAVWSVWPLVFGIGAALAAAGFWHLARNVQGQIGREFNRQAAIKWFLNFNLRLCLTGVVLFVLIVKLQVPLLPLLAGLTFTVACIVVWSVAKIAGKPIKES